MWCDVAMNSLTFSRDSHLHGTDKYIESWVHLKIHVTLNSNELQIENTFKPVSSQVFYSAFFSIANPIPTPASIFP